MTAYIMAIIAAISVVEGNPGGGMVREKHDWSSGPLCIRQIMLDDYHRITGKTVTLAECKSMEVSKRVAVAVLTHYTLAYQRRHGHLPSVKYIAGKWNPSAEYQDKVRVAYKKGKRK